MTLIALLLPLLTPAAHASCEQVQPSLALDQLYLAIEQCAPASEGESGKAGDSDDAPDALDTFRALLAGVKWSNPPETWDAPAEIWSHGFQAWDNSLQGDDVREQGGLLARQADGSFVFRRGPEGDARQWTPDYTTLREGEVSAAVLHTHPYASDDGGWERITFSGDDLGIMAWTPEAVEFVQSGDTLFAAVKSKEFMDIVGALDRDQRAALQRVIQEDHRALVNDLLSRGHSFPDAMHQTVTAVAARYGILYYTARAGEPFTRMK